MTAHPYRRNDINMTVDERRSYVRWWVERSGLTPAQIREVATGIWSDPLVDDIAASLSAPASVWSGNAASHQTAAALPGGLFRSATGSDASEMTGDS